ncbi:glutamate synthase-related protein [Suttonella sp. R2A3]|uniref:glutamate synthase-related protein n=1 Tax=Suttonella sp. R2A3 TaxID=2908648 RepID=UPI001F18D441|nr:glutamate synthase-related protein [Suttonella sp. R2A3]UJF25126.1 glutamate synthase-related protein [Suttonella sp. R2A3]
MGGLLYNISDERSNCGVGFITHKRSIQTHELLELANQALCKVPHRGGFNAEGVGDGGGVGIDLSPRFYRHLTGLPLEAGSFAVGNFFLPTDQSVRISVLQYLQSVLDKHGLDVLHRRDVPVSNSALNEASQKAQMPIVQWVLSCPDSCTDWDSFEHFLCGVLLEIEENAVNEHQFPGFYPLSFSSRTQVYKGLLNSWEVFPYYDDLRNPEHEVSMLWFHTRFSTNTAPNPSFAQPFRRLAHNGELNTDRKSRISELAVARHEGYKLVFPKGQSDSARLDQTLMRRLWDDRQPIDEIMVKMMPPAWENKQDEYPLAERDMLAYFSLSEEKNDGPAGLVFCDGIKIGAALDRLGLRPLRTVETDDYAAAMSEAGQIDFPPESVTRRGRIKAGGMFVFDHASKTLNDEYEILARMAAAQPYGEMLRDKRVRLSALPEVSISELSDTSPLDFTSRHIAYSLNQESFRFLLDPMLDTGAERVSAMGYGLAINAVTGVEGGMSRYFTQRFAQVTNPPLDSIRETEGMTLRVSLGGKPNFVRRSTKQLVLESPLLLPQELAAIERAGAEGILRVGRIEALYDYCENPEENQASLEAGLAAVCEQVWTLCKAVTDIIILDDSGVSKERAALPAVLLSAMVNRYLIDNGFRFHTSIVYHSGQIASTHDVALILGFGASAVCPATVYNRARELYGAEGTAKAMAKFKKALHKSLLKTMGKFGLCTVESYSGGAFFEPAFLDTEDPKLAPYFPNSYSPLGGVGFSELCYSAWQWHQSAVQHHEGEDVPLLGLFKERGDGAGHSYGNVAVRTFGEMTEEAISFAEVTSREGERLDILPQDDSYLFQSHQPRTPEQIDAHRITPAYEAFIEAMNAERVARPSALRDLLGFPADVTSADSQAAFTAALATFKTDTAVHSAVRGMTVTHDGSECIIKLDNPSKARHQALAGALQERFASLDIVRCDDEALQVKADDEAQAFFDSLIAAPKPIALDDIQPAHEITANFTGGAMSHGSLLFKAHQAVAIGANMVGAKSNSGEGGEHPSRYNSIRASKIKQIASGRFGVWAGYLADPMLEELEIKIGQGAKPGEGGQLPAQKVTVEIASMRGGTPGVELVSPPPHHDTYSIEDLGQLIHDCKAARVKVIVKLVSSEGVGTIAVGVAKAGADIINIAGNTGGTGAAQVTSLKHSGRIAELGLVEVHQALTLNGLREKVELRCSGAHQTGSDIIKSAMLGGDSFEFGTTCLMMLKCVMAKNCNIKCPVGLTTPHEVFDGDPRALAQYFLNVAHDVRRLLAELGFSSLQAIRGRADLLHLIDHPNLVGRYHMEGMLQHVSFDLGKEAVALEADYTLDEALWHEFNDAFSTMAEDDYLAIDVDSISNTHKTVAGRFGIDVERYLNYQFTDMHPKVYTLTDGRRVLSDGAVEISSSNAAGQSFGAFNNSGITLIHRGTCNDGVGKSMSGGRIIVQDPGGGSHESGGNVLLGNFALFGATGGELYAAGEAGDRFGVRNSGAVSVIEGVGDFGCEYMTNGAVVNIGSFGRGFGNGMSGGVAYQYDPSGKIAEHCAKDSVSAIALDSEHEALSGQEDALLWYLSRHAAFAESALAEQLLNDWENVRHDFYCLLPNAWIAAHDGREIASDTDRATMVSELAAGITQALLDEVGAHYAAKTPLFAGRLPGEALTSASDYMVAAGIFFRAQEQVRERGVDDIAEAAKKLLLNDDRSLHDTLQRDVIGALADYEDGELAHLLAAQRVDDYCRALSMRANFDSHALGTYAWILHRRRANTAALLNITPIKEPLAQRLSGVIAEAMYQQREQNAA